MKGSFLIAHYTVPHLVLTKGHIIFVSSYAAQLRLPKGSSDGTSKHAMNRFAEFVDTGALISPDTAPIDIDATILFS
jgi:NAD(P)-dependent dehydrogenase (short-subunit alcohol dehydrogenase family)